MPVKHPTPATGCFSRGRHWFTGALPFAEEAGLDVKFHRVIAPVFRRPFRAVAAREINPAKARLFFDGPWGRKIDQAHDCPEGSSYDPIGQENKAQALSSANAKKRARP